MAISDIILPVGDDSVNDVIMQVSQRVKKCRLALNLTQEGLALRAELKVPTYRRFERTGEISLRGLLQIAFALNRLSDFKDLFAGQQYSSLDDVIRATIRRRRRGKYNE